MERRSQSTPRRERSQLSSSSIAPATTPDVAQSASTSATDVLLNPANLTSAIKQNNAKLASQSTAEPYEKAEEEIEESIRGMLRWGWGMLIGSFGAFVFGIWSMIVGPFIDTEGIPVLNTMAKDQHYKYLLVFLVPVTLYAVIINWWGLKIFRHA